VPQTTGLGGDGWTCSVETDGQTVSCSYPASLADPVAAGTGPASVSMPVVVDVSGIPASDALPDHATATSSDAGSASGEDDTTYVPPALSTSLTDNSGAGELLKQGRPYTFTAQVTVAGGGGDEIAPITLTDKFPTGVVPQTTGLGGDGWTCSVETDGQTVSCSYPASLADPVAAGTGPASVSMPVVVDVSGIPASDALPDHATATSSDAGSASGEDDTTYVPPTLTMSLTGGNGNLNQGSVVTYSAAVTVSGGNEIDPITVTDTFPASLVPQSTGLGGTGWSCSISGGGQTVTCTYAASLVPATSQVPAGSTVTVNMPVAVEPPCGATTTNPVQDTANATSSDSLGATATDSGNFVPDTLSFTQQPVTTQVNKPMMTASNTQADVQVSAIQPGGTSVDTRYDCPVTLSFAVNPGGAQFVTNYPTSPPTLSPTLVQTATNGTAHFVGIVINKTDVGYQLLGSDGPSAPSGSLHAAATSSAFDVDDVVTGCQTYPCTVTDSTTDTTAQVTVNSAPATAASFKLAATSPSVLLSDSIFGTTSNVFPLLGCVPFSQPNSGVVSTTTTGTGAAKTVVMTLSKTLTHLVDPNTGTPNVTVCFGEPFPFTTAKGTPKAAPNPLNGGEYEGVLPNCSAKIPAPCVVSEVRLSGSRDQITVGTGGQADPKVYSP
jgi:hypothetical protein